MRVLIDEEERYPIYSIVRAESGKDKYHPSRYIDMPEKDVKRFEKIEADFKAAQEELCAIFEKAGL